MTSEEVLQKMIRVMRQTSLPVFIAEVTEVKGNVCSVIFPDGFELTGVRLKAAIDEKKEFVLITPKIKSTVLLSSLSQNESDGDFYVIACNEVASISGVIDKTKFSIDKTAIAVSIEKSNVLLKAAEITINQDETKVVLKGGVASVHGKDKLQIETDRGTVKEVLLKFATFLKSIKVLTGSPGSPSPILPVLLSDIVQIEEYINDIFE